MLTIMGRKHTFCDGICRRDFLKIGALSTGLTLADLLQAKAASAPAAAGKRPSARSVILIWLVGGPSHIDMYDMKPEAPVEFRGEFKPTHTNVPGIDICEHMPLQARLFDKLALIRSCRVSADAGHNDVEVTTGVNRLINQTERRPSMGAVLSKLRNGGTGGVPAYVNLRLDGTGALDGPYGVEPGFLGPAHRAYTPAGPDLDNLRLGKHIGMERLNERQALLAHFDSIRRDIDAAGAMQGMDAFSARAVDMVTSGAVRKALDLSQEPLAVRERYRGAEQFLSARRLVEAGVGCVTLSISGWDTHDDNFARLKQRLLPVLDCGFASLIQDLHDRGLENDVATLLCGEMGRTPRVNNKNAGRDHWIKAMSVVVAGGGLKMGQVIGATDARAEVSKERPYRMTQVLSTLYQALGIDPSLRFPNEAGRPVHLLDDREPVAELMR
jgi:hypothetical protein